jgi:L-ascorbate metabolism protein UlaG (beta-lactamase superfamily)
MFITWYGHAAFLLQAEGTRVALDPYRAPDVGTYAPIDDVADIVAISHDNAKYHSYTQALREPSGGEPALMDGLALLEQAQPYCFQAATFTATKVWENDERREPIAMVGVTLGGVRVLHMGDCGHRLTDDEVKACGKVDVLLALAGGPPTLTLPDLVDFVVRLAPRIVIPMHFGNPKINLNLHPVESFLALLPPAIPVRPFNTPTVEVTEATLPLSTEVWVLPPAR